MLLLLYATILDNTKIRSSNLWTSQHVFFSIRAEHFPFSLGNQITIAVIYRRLVETKHIIQSFYKSNGPKMTIFPLYTAEISGKIQLCLYKVALIFPAKYVLGVWLHRFSQSLVYSLARWVNCNSRVEGLLQKYTSNPAQWHKLNENN